MASSCVRFPKVQLRSPSDNFPSLDTFKEITINSYRFIKKRDVLTMIYGPQRQQGV